MTDTMRGVLGDEHINNQFRFNKFPAIDNHFDTLPSDPANVAFASVTMCANAVQTFSV
jgi:hypothetical protein